MLGIRSGLLTELMTDGDDWSFVIKSHAVIEGAVTHLIVATIRQPQVHDVFARLELSNEATGKLAVAKKLDLLPKPHRRFIRALSELRNQLAHDVRNVDFSFSSYLAQMDAGQRKTFDTAFGGIFSESEGAKSDPHDAKRHLFWKWAANPRFLVWASTFIVISWCYSAKVREELDSRLLELDREVARNDAELAELARTLLPDLLKALAEKGATIRVRQKVQ
jgi:hypothetical protein